MRILKHRNCLNVGEGKHSKTWWIEKRHFLEKPSGIPRQFAVRLKLMLSSSSLYGKDHREVLKPKGNIKHVGRSKEHFVNVMINKGKVV